MRDRVARTRSLVTVSFVALLMVASAGAAFAQDGTGAGVPFNFGGPLGIGVAAVGLTGMVLGIWRFFRKLAKDKVAAAEAPTAVQPVLAMVEPETTPAAVPAPQPATP